MATIDKKWLDIKNYISVSFTPVADIGDKKILQKQSSKFIWGCFL